MFTNTGKQKCLTTNVANVGVVEKNCTENDKNMQWKVYGNFIHSEASAPLMCLDSATIIAGGNSVGIATCGDSLNPVSYKASQLWGIQTLNPTQLMSVKSVLYQIGTSNCYASNGDISPANQLKPCNPYGN